LHNIAFDGGYMKLRILYILIPIAIGILASATGFSLLWRLFILSCLVLLISYLWALISIRNISTTVSPLPPQNRMGDVLDHPIKLTNHSRFPKFLLKIQEVSDLPGYSSNTVVTIGPRSSQVVPSQVHCTRRGRYSIGPIIMSTNDPLGLFQQNRRPGMAQSILVTPNIVDLPFFDPLAAASHRYGAGKWLSSEISPNVASIREYVSGDSLRHIHWQTTAHSATLMVKVFDPDRSRSSVKTIWIVLDLAQASQAGQGLESTEEYAVSLAASLAQKFIDLGWPVGLLAQAEQPVEYDLDSGQGHLANILNTLAIVQARGKVPIEHLLATASNRFDHNTLTMVITPAQDDRVVKSLLQIRRQMGAVVLLALDAASFTGERPAGGIPAILMHNGVQVYVIKKNDHLAAALDSRKL
jgi:uncharacterized protein (DUF58 family)